MKKQSFLKSLHSRLSEVNEFLSEAERTDNELLKKRPDPKSWSVYDCLDHLVRYNDFYLPEFTKAITKAPDSSKADFTRGWFGEKSAKSMLPGENGVKIPMKTFRSKNPSLGDVNENALTLFSKQQREFEELLEKAEGIDIGKAKIRTTLPLIRFRLADGLEFVINHQVRHIEQAKRALKKALSSQNRIQV